MDLRELARLAASVAPQPGAILAPYAAECGAWRRRSRRLRAQGEIVVELLPARRAAKGRCATVNWSNVDGQWVIEAINRDG
jgi:hypothetical protein